MKAAAKVARANHLRPIVLNQEVWDEAFGDGGFDLHDGWARCFSLSKMGILYVYKRVRMESEDLKSLSPEAAQFKVMTKWPRNRLKHNPWRSTFFPRTVVRAPEWDEAKKQFKVVFDCKPSLTLWFCDEYVKAPALAGWLIPRKQSKTVPWEKGGAIIEEVKEPRLWVPVITAEENRMLLEGNTSQVIRNLHKRHADDLKEKRICVMDIKDGVDKLLEVLEK